MHRERVASHGDGSSGDADTAQRGMALLVVLWIIASAALLVSAFNVIARSGATFVASEVQQAKAEALLEAGAEIAASELIGKQSQQSWVADGRPHAVSFGGADLTISVRDPNGLVDLNRADSELLLGLLRAHAPEAEATRVLDAILAMRGEDAATGKPKPKSAAPAPTGPLAGKPLGKKPTAPPAASAEGGEGDKPARPIVFIDPDQIRSVQGMSLRLYRAVAPLVTVYSRDGRINLATAPDAVLASVPNITRIDVMRARDAARSPVKDDKTLADIKQRAGATVSDEAGPAYIVTVRLALGERYRAAREFVIAVGLDENAPYRLIAKKTLALN